MKCLEATYTTGTYFTVTKSSVRRQTRRRKPFSKLSLIILPRLRPSTRDKRPSSITELQTGGSFTRRCSSSLQTLDFSHIVHLTQQLTEHLSDHHNFSTPQVRKMLKTEKNEVKSLKISFFPFIFQVS